MKGTIAKPATEPAAQTNTVKLLGFWRRLRTTVAFRIASVLCAVGLGSLVMASPAGATSSTDLTGGNAATFTNDLKNFFTGTLEGQLIGIAVVITAFWMLYKAVRRVVSR